MGDLLLTLTPIALLDSLSLLPFALVVLAVLLSGPRPYLAAAGFLAGTFVSYLAAGVLIALGLGQTIERVSALVVHRFWHPQTIDYALSIVVGVALVTLGYRWATARRVRAARREPATAVGPAQAFGVGAGATLAGLWGALPYFAAIDQLLKADVTTGEAVIALAVYNVVFVSGPASLVLVRAVMGRRADAVFVAVNRLVSDWGRRALIAGMTLLGAVMTIDGVGGLVGRPVIPVG